MIKRGIDLLNDLLTKMNGVMPSDDETVSAYELSYWKLDLANAIDEIERELKFGKPGGS